MPRSVFYLVKGRSSLIDSSIALQVVSDYKPEGDQPKAIAELLNNFSEEKSRQVLLGVTGSGKTFTMAKVIESLQRPALVIAHNKTLAAQLYSEFSELFPNNAVRYFVSYYDYFQPEAYLPSSDTYIEKDASINDEIDKLRHAATKALLERRDTIVVSSVSCIYGLGDPENYFDLMLYLEVGDELPRNDILKKLVALRYVRNDIEFSTGTFRVRGDVIEVCPASESERSIRIEMFGDEVEGIFETERLSGEVIRKLEKACIYPASHFITRKDQLELAIDTIREELGPRLKELNSQGKTLEAHRLEQRTLYDLELLGEMGFCPGVENYSRHMTGRAAGEAPPTLLDYFPKDFITFIDESHVTVPQLVGMYRGDRSRKQSLVDYGFRLPSAVDNRPLRFDEFEIRAPRIFYVSATPGDYELEDSAGNIVEQIIRPTGLLDPVVVIKPATNQVEDLLSEIHSVIERNERVLVTTLTKRMAEDLTDYYREVGLKVKYLHSGIHTLDRIDLIRGLREGEFDVLVGINLLREGLDLPEVSLVAILDADKEGFLRSERSLVQTMGRAARNIDGKVILYADKKTKSIVAAIGETERRRKIQHAYNQEHGITPRSVKRTLEVAMVEGAEIALASTLVGSLRDEFPEIPKSITECKKLIEKLKKEMFTHAKEYEFEKAAVIRDKIALLEKFMLSL